MPACDGDIGMCYRSVSVVSFAACAACFSLRAAFRVCHDFDSVFGFGFSFLCESRLFGVVVDAMYPSFRVIGRVQCYFGVAPPFLSNVMRLIDCVAMPLINADPFHCGNIAPL